jgi:hypothetical protein
MAASRRLCLAIALVAASAGAAPAARAQGIVGEGAARLEGQVDALGAELEERLAAFSPTLAELARRVKLGGHVSGVWLDAQRDSQVFGERRQIWDARLFADLLLAQNAGPGDAVWLRSAALSFEWNLIRVGRKADDVGETYLELQGLLDSSWLNAQLGRFQIPVGEAYLRYSRGARDNPFLSNAVSGAWWWDEGVKLYGSDARGRFGYVASLGNGETPQDWGLDGGDQYTLKLFLNPTSWLHVSASGLYSGRTGDDSEPAEAALWLGEAWARAFGSGSGVPSWVDGALAPDGPGRLDSTLYLGADAVLTHPAGARLWLSYGSYEIDSAGRAIYDRRLHGWLAELVLEGRLASPELRAFYLALRANGLGTYDGGEGYLLDVRTGRSLGYNLRALDAYSVAIGWRLTRWTTLKLEYTHQRFSLVRGARAALGDAADDTDFLGAELAVFF